MFHKALIPNRRFYKTEWTKPKFVNKPYTTARENTTRSENEEYEEKLAQPYIETTQEIASTHVTTKFSKDSYPPSVKIPNCCRIKNRAPATFFPLNLERLLDPPITSRAYILVRYFASDIEGNDIFWRPKARIPDETEMVRRLRDPDLSTRKQAEREAKYLFLNYGKVQYLKKKNDDSTLGQHNTPKTQQSVMNKGLN